MVIKCECRACGERQITNINQLVVYTLTFIVDSCFFFMILIDKVKKKCITCICQQLIDYARKVINFVVHVNNNIYAVITHKKLVIAQYKQILRKSS